MKKIVQSLLHQK